MLEIKRKIHYVLISVKIEANIYANVLEIKRKIIEIKKFNSFKSFQINCVKKEFLSQLNINIWLHSKAQANLRKIICIPSLLHTQKTETNKNKEYP